MKTKKIWATLHPFYEGGEIMGRGIANEDFLRALLQANPYDEYHFFLSSPKQVEILKKPLLAEFSQLPLFFDVQYNLPKHLQTENYHVFHLSDWLTGFVPLCSLRNSMAKNIFPVTGIIHSLSYARYHAEFLQHIWPGCTGRDAIVTTSLAGGDVMRAAFASLKENYNLPQSFNNPLLPQIPLAIASVPPQAEIDELRLGKRAELGLAENDILLLYVGRISHYSKMDFLPLLRALRRVGEQLKSLSSGANSDSKHPLRHIHLLLAGWNDPDDRTLNILASFSKVLGLNFTIVSRPEMQERNSLYAAADIFVSPSDNLQETFGITLLEAGAFGLPVVASDFDGYRDTVQHGVTGFLAKSTGPRTTSNTDRLAHFCFDNQYHLSLAQQTAVNVAELASYLCTLITNEDLRCKMGEAARRRVQEKFIWSKVIGQYVELWQQLQSVPVPDDLNQKTHPMQLSYANLFKGHPSIVLDDSLILTWSRSGEALYRGLEAPVIYAGLSELLCEDVLKKLMFLARKPLGVAELLVGLSSLGLYGEDAEFIVLWAMKHDFLEEV